MAQRTLGRQAVVVGASVAGLFAARALSDYFEKVVVLEREDLPDGVQPRKAVPQGRHIHAILPPVYDTLKQLMPEVIDDLRASGADLFDGGEGMRWHLGEWLVQGLTGLTFIAATRPLFESRLRRHVESLDNVEIRQSTRFLSWQLDHRHAVRGLLAAGFDDRFPLEFDLAVDARGAASQLPGELTELGFDPPVNEVVEVDLTYTSGLFELSNSTTDWQVLMINPMAPAQWTGGVAEWVEGKRLLVTLWGYFGTRAPANADGFRRFAGELAVPDLAHVLERAEAVSPFRQFRIPRNRWHRYDRLKRFPDRLLVVGDAFCKLNPIYGQGMTKAAKEGLFLWESLDRCHDLKGFSDRFRRRVGGVGAEWAWELTSSADLAFPQAIGKRSWTLKLSNAYTKRVFAAAATRLEIRKALLEALALVAPPTRLLRPSVISRVLWHQSVL